MKRTNVNEIDKQLDKLAWKLCGSLNESKDQYFYVALTREQVRRLYEIMEEKTNPQKSYYL